MTEGQDKKGEFLETNSSEYSISKSKTQGIFDPRITKHRIMLQNKIQDHLYIISNNEIEG